MIFFLLLLNLISFKETTPSKIDFSSQLSYFRFSDFQLASEEGKRFVLSEEISAKGVLVKEFQGKTLYAKNSQNIFPIASLTKLLASYLALEIFLPEEVLTFSEEAVNQPGEVGYFKVGEKVKIIDLLKASLVASSNDSIFLISQKFGNQKFIQLLNQKFKEWGLQNTFLVEPTGISSRNVSTPEELATLAFKIFANRPEIFYLTTYEKVIINGKILWTTNLLLPKYSKIIVGGKTGYTDEAGECLLLLLKFPSSPYVVLVLLNSQDRFKDAEIIIKALAKYYNYEL